MKKAQSEHEAWGGVLSGRGLGWVATVNRAAKLVDVEKKGCELPAGRGTAGARVGRCACAVGRRWGERYCVGSCRRASRPRAGV